MAFTKPRAAQINFDVTNISDPLIRLNSGQSGSNDKDIGIVVERGSDTNVAFIWDESADSFAVINTTEDGSTSGNVTISSYANIRAGTFYGDGSNLTGIPASYGDSDVGTYLSSNGYGTSSSIIASITDSAPSTLDTLNELAAALGDDANFSTTVTASIATKLPLAGGTMSGAIAMGTNKITGMGDPTSAQDAATKAYVDSQVSSVPTLANLGYTGATNANYITNNNQLTNGAGYTTNTGDITNVSVSGTGLSGGGASGSVTITSNATSSNTGGTIVARDGSGNFSAGVITGTSTAARYADLAERYTTDADYEPGTVLIFGGEEEVTLCTKKYDRRIAGIVSVDPAYLMNNDLQNASTVALVGRVPCKVVGFIRKGDLMVSSDTDGHAEAWRDESSPPYGTVIGKSLENKDSRGTGVVEVVVGAR